MTEIPVGSQWRDNDPRIRDRVVTVTAVSSGYVYYKSAVKARSQLKRFLKAFTREPDRRAKAE